MKLKILMMMLLQVALIGCSLCKTKTVYIEPKKVKFELIDVNVTAVEKFKPIDVNVSQDGKKIITSVSTFLKIKRIAKRLRLHLQMYELAHKGLYEQIRRYNDER